MLVVPREHGKAVVIGNQCVVRIEEIREQDCRITVIAPAGIAVEQGKGSRNVDTSTPDGDQDDQNHPLQRATPALCGEATTVFVGMGQCFHIHDVIVYLMDILPTKVRLGIEAPSALTIHRLEVFETIQSELRLTDDGYGF